MPQGKRAGDFHSKDKRKLPIFIQSELDDYGLTCPEFRVYSRIARRAGATSKATESVPNMAEAFGIDVSTVRRALKVLCLCRLISKKDRPGWTPEYSLEDQDKWRDRSELKAVREAVLHPKKVTLTPMPSEHGSDKGEDHETQETLITTHETPCSPDTDEGTPQKVLPEGTPNPPVSPKGSYKSPITPPPEDSPHQDLIRFIEEHNGKLPFPGKEGKAIKWLLVQGYTVEQCKGCFECLAAEPWRSAAVTWKTVQGQIGNWVKKGEPQTFIRSASGNGHRPNEIKEGDVIQDDGGDIYFTAGPDGTPMYNFRTAEAFALHYGYDVEKVKAKWN